jgi:two-component system, cell cycle sensor histidine kinase and response regulator CckA
MTPRKTPSPPGGRDADEEVSALIETLHQTEQRLEQLTSGEVDTVADSHGRTFLLRRAQDQLRLSEAAKQTAILNALPAYIALLDTQGRIISVNEAWQRFGSANVLHGPGYEVGLNYLEICDSAQGDDASEVHQVAEGIRSVLAGGVKSFSIEYPCHSPTELLWFLLTVMPLADDHPNGVVVMHLDITERKRAEQAQARLVAIIEATPDMVATGDPNGQVLYYNRAGLRMLGFEPGLDPSTVRFLDTHPDWAAKLVAETGVPYAIAHGTWSGETALLRRDGREIPISQVLIAHKAPDGSVEYLSTIARDITLQKEHEQHITRLNRVYAVLSGINTTIVRTRDRQELFDEACRIAVELGKFRLAWIGLLDANGLDVTPVARAGVDEGYLDSVQLTVGDDAPDRCELVARALREKTAVVCNDVDADPQMAHWREEALRRGYRSVVVFPLQLKDKMAGLLVLYASEAGFFDTEEMRLLTEIASDISFALDHTEKVAELRLQGAALNAAANSIVITDRNGTIEWVNPAFTALSGYGAEEAIGKKQSELSKSGVHDQLFYRDLWDTILAGHVWQGEMTNRRKDRSVYIVDQTITSVKGARGETDHFIAIGRDLTEQKRLEAQVRQANKMDAVGQLASGVAHDFNNLLTVILGFADIMVADAAMGSEHETDLGEIIKAAQRAAGLTKQLLAFSRQQVLHAVPVDVNGLITEMTGMLVRLIGENIEVSLALAPNLSLALADRGQLEQVVMNLVVNARDAMPDGGSVTIETADVELENSSFHAETVMHGCYVMLAITDTGSGMTKETQRRLFEPFFTTKEAGKGTGLGLSTTYGIIKQSKGYIWVYSEPGRGTTFKVYLPCSNRELPLQAVNSVVTAPVKRPSETVLLTEDEAGVRQLAKRILENAGYRVLEAANGDEGERLFAQHSGSIDLLVTDVIMPGCGGPELLSRLHVQSPTLRVLYMSGYTEQSAATQTGIDRGIPFVQKPFTAAEFVRQVREALDR